MFVSMKLTSSIPRLEYAVSLAKALEAVLKIHIDVPDKMSSLAARVTGSIGDELAKTMRETQCERVREYIKGISSNYPFAVTCDQMAHPEYILIRNAVANYYHSVLISHNEQRISKGKKIIIGVPLGNSESGEYALGYALGFAERTKAKLVFYHATYCRADIASNDPRVHISSAARELLTKASRAAVSKQIDFDVKIEMPETVESGIARSLEYCDLLIMAYGQDTIKGSYVDGVREQSRVPLCIVQRKEKRDGD